VTKPLSMGGKARLPANWLPGTAQQQGALSIALSAALWGLFWIPLRFLDEHGVTGLWAVVLVMATVSAPSTLVLILSRKLHVLKSRRTWLIGCSLGLSVVLYFAGVIVSDVIRVVFLFYLLPIWTTLAARIIYKEPITRKRLIVIAMALSGLWLLLGGGNTLPIPSNIGDWCGLFAGITWGVSLAFIRGKEDADASGMVCTTSIGAAVMAVVVAVLLLNSGNTQLASLPKVDSVAVVTAATVGFSLLILFPSLVGQIWGAQRIAAPTAALLTMTEIMMATVSAYLLIGTELNIVSIIGAATILSAVFIDIAMQYKEKGDSGI